MMKMIIIITILIQLHVVQLVTYDNIDPETFNDIKSLNKCINDIMSSISSNSNSSCTANKSDINCEKLNADLMKFLILFCDHVVDAKLANYYKQM